MVCTVLVNWLSKVAYLAILVGKEENHFSANLLSLQVRSWLDQCSVTGQTNVAVFKSNVLVW